MHIKVGDLSPKKKCLLKFDPYGQKGEGLRRKLRLWSSEVPGFRLAVPAGTLQKRPHSRLHGKLPWRPHQYLQKLIPKYLIVFCSFLEKSPKTSQCRTLRDLWRPRFFHDITLVWDIRWKALSSGQVQDATPTWRSLKIKYFDTNRKPLHLGIFVMTCQGFVWDFLRWYE